MSRIKQIGADEVLNYVIKGTAVYMLTKLTECTMLEDIIDAEAFVILEEAEEEQGNVRR